ncbi:MAG: DUF1499 domain-containing protein [Coxiellaceae bacterium]|nr:DUF1499 domain-containing protein [Coxiellaceae bacterium]
MIFIDWQQSPLVDFQHLQVSSKPHYCVVSPDCRGERCIKSPILPMSVEKLQHQWQQMITQQPRVKLLKKDDAKHQFQYVQRSKWMRFPDLIDVQFAATGNNQSTLYAYSRSIYGHSDLGVNCKRMHHWLAGLK